MITNIHIITNTKARHSIEFEQEKNLHKIINNQNFLNFLKKTTFKNLPFDVELFVVDSKKYKKQTKCSEELQKIKTKIVMQALFRSIVFSQTKNINSIKLTTKCTGLHPMKPSKKGFWMLGHKLGHGVFNQQINLFLKNKIEFILQECYNKFHKTAYTNYEKDIKGWDEVFKKISPFKSAQECIIIPDNDEYIYELVAQYSMFGKTKFLFPSQIFSNQTEAEEVSKTIDQLIFESLTNVVGEIVYGD